MYKEFQLNFENPNMCVRVGDYLLLVMLHLDTDDQVDSIQNVVCNLDYDNTEKVVYRSNFNPGELYTTPYVMDKYENIYWHCSFNDMQSTFDVIVGSVD